MAAENWCDEKVDEAIEETFPASDPPANTVETGAQIGPAPKPAAASRNTGPSKGDRRPNRFRVSRADESAAA